MRALVVGDGHIGQAGAVEEAAEFLDVAEAQARMALRDLGGRARADLRGRVAEEALHALPAGLGPPGEGNPPTRSRSAHALGQRGLGIGEMAEPEAARHRVERLVGKRQMLDLRNPEVDALTQLPGKLDHPRRQVDAGDVRAAPLRLGSKQPGARRHVEVPRPGGDSCGGEQRPDGEPGDAGEERVIGRRHRIVGAALERPQALRLLRREVRPASRHRQLL